ncbi:hypothetical protein CC80DRAFT_536757 [Byssothecium circinans]|uniref:Oxidoreductase acuF-like C2H2 type zinc-finger domain-containing protein n=1 Tax=Byssothecium circinans TaxID=147558 RepID=A0A6A5TPH1_9PLEO|nr:hypothetical protein CC80DRAFT_536757 [Byssothecium circinans]
MSIVEHYERCLNEFHYLSGLLYSSNTSSIAVRADVDEEIDRYKLWAGNVGAHQSGKNYSLSLDYRLREASFYRDRVIDLLAVLERHLQKAITTQQGIQPAYDDDSVAGSENESLDFGEIEEVGDNTEGSSWDISDTDSEVSLGEQLRQHSMANSASTSYAPKETSGNNFISLHAITHTINCLYQLPLRRPAPISRIREESEHELRHFEHFDILYVKDKFPLLAEPIAVRLGKLITRRRQLLQYRKGHQEKLQQPSSTGTRPQLTSAFATTNKVKRPVEETPSEPTIRANSQKTKTTTQTKATTANIEHIKHDLGRIPESRPATSVAASESTRKLRLYIPPRPLLKTRANELGLNVLKTERTRRSEFFECNYCRLLPTITSDLMWKRHVLSDLQPYVCTFSNCDLSSHFFADRDTWYAHETQHHRVEFHCNTASHHAFLDEKSFREHMKTAHNTALQIQHSEALQNIFQRPTHSMKGNCNLCMRHTTKLKLHISRHLEQLALFAIPRADYLADDDADDADSNAANRNVGDSVEKQTSVSDAESEGTPSSSSGSKVSRGSYKVGDYAEQESGDDTSVVDQAEPIPDEDAFSWDFATDKFQSARLEQSEPPPIQNLTDPGRRYKLDKGNDPQIAKWVLERGDSDWADVEPVQNSVSLHRYQDHALTVKSRTQIEAAIKALYNPVLIQKIEHLVEQENAILQRRRPDLQWKIAAVESNWKDGFQLLLSYNSRDSELERVVIILKTYVSSLSQPLFQEPTDSESLTKDQLNSSARGVFNEWNQRYNEPDLTYEEFFKPPELREENCAPAIPINPNEGVPDMRVYTAQEERSADREKRPRAFTFRLIQPSPPNSPKIAGSSTIPPPHIDWQIPPRATDK